MKKRSAFRETWKDYLSFSKRERRGILAMLLIIFIQIGILIWLNYFPSKELPKDYSGFIKDVDKFYHAEKSSSDSTDEDDELNEKPQRRKPELFAFNPNNLPAEDWQRLGFSEKQAKVIKNFESKGGKFRSKEDVKKMFCISDSDYKRIEPYISIPVNTDTIRKKYVRPVVMVDIGTADSIELTDLKGIGPGYARRIYNYRDHLGGFLKKEQLLEVWGMSDSLYQTLLPNICLKDSTNIRKVNLNSADFNTLRIHPYIGYQLASIIINYRKQHNGFKATEEIKKIPLVNDELYSKLAPYLDIK